MHNRTALKGAKFHGHCAPGVVGNCGRIGLLCRWYTPIANGTISIVLAFYGLVVLYDHS